MNKFILILVLLTTALGCGAQDSGGETTATATNLSIKIGETTSFKDYNLRFERVIDDSRCPENVTCVWAGEAKVLTNFIENNEEKALELIFSTDSINEEHPKFLFLSGKDSIHAVQLAPYPSEGKKIAIDDYRIILKANE